MVIHRKDFFEILRTEHRLAVKLLWQFTGVLANRLAETTRNLGIAREELVGEDITCEVFGPDDEGITAEIPVSRRARARGDPVGSLAPRARARSDGRFRLPRSGCCSRAVTERRHGRRRPASRGQRCVRGVPSARRSPDAARPDAPRRPAPGPASRRRRSDPLGCRVHFTHGRAAARLGRGRAARAIASWARIGSSSPRAPACT
jgi:hypothetical protein